MDTRAEFALIARHFRPLAGTDAAAQALSNDAAVLAPPAGYNLVLTADMIVAGVHFVGTEPGGLVARKLLRANLSDLAAMGAKPRGALLAAGFSATADEAWIADFAEGLGRDLDRYGLSLIGGDTVRTRGAGVFSLTAVGEVRDGCDLQRGTAQTGDAIYVTGTIGDGALGLKVVQGDLGRLSVPERDHLRDRYHLPQPRTAVGVALVEAGVRCAIDVSDGLVADLGHLCRASGLTAIIDRDLVPLSGAAKAVVAADPTEWPTVLNGGDDYELLFAAPESLTSRLQAMARDLDVVITRIGTFWSGPAKVKVNGPDGPLVLPPGGFDHFAAFPGGDGR